MPRGLTNAKAAPEDHSWVERISSKLAGADTDGATISRAAAVHGGTMNRVKWKGGGGGGKKKKKKGDSGLQRLHTTTADAECCFVDRAPQLHSKPQKSPSFRCQQKRREGRKQGRRRGPCRRLRVTTQPIDRCDGWSSDAGRWGSGCGAGEGFPPSSRLLSRLLWLLASGFRFSVSGDQIKSDQILLWFFVPQNHNLTLTFTEEPKKADICLRMRTAGTEMTSSMRWKLESSPLSRTLARIDFRLVVRNRCSKAHLPPTKRMFSWSNYLPLFTASKHNHCVATGR